MRTYTFFVILIKACKPYISFYDVNKFGNDQIVFFLLVSLSNVKLKLYRRLILI